MAVQVSEVDREDLRLAVVMNGGVSLAIWIGGVTREIGRLVSASPSPGTGAYAGLLDLVHATARVDVIAGTSAGGINGAFLALATVYGTDLGGLGRLWADRGGLSDLLRSPLDADPASLLRGDTYFLPQLRDAIASLYPDGAEPRPPEQVPVELIMTTSLMDGQPRAFVDDFGTRITEIDHRGLFRFSRRAVPRPRDDFAGPEVIGRLALASRSTASFPVAFEPSFVPVGVPGPDRLHPDLAGTASWDGSRFVLDGGLLLNKPIRPCLEAVLAQPAERQVRRVLAYINPDPGDPAAIAAADPAHPPTLARVVLDALVRLPGAQSVSAELEDLTGHNRHIRGQRLLRTELVGLLPQDPGPLARQMYPAYRAVRRRRELAAIAISVATATASGGPTLTSGARGWAPEEILEALERSADLPMLLPATYDEAREPGSFSRWGLPAFERLGATVLDLTKRALWIVPLGPDGQDLRGTLRAMRGLLHGYLLTLRGFRDDVSRFWAAMATELGSPPAQAAERSSILDGWVTTVTEQWPLAASQATSGEEDAQQRRFLLDGLVETVGAIVRLLVDAAGPLRRAVDLGRGSGVPSRQREADRLDGLLSRLLPPGDPTVTAVTDRLMALEILYLTAGGDAEHVEQEVALMQISGDTPSSFGGPATARGKLAGVQLAHFGAFYKRSWRVNDWIWGRLDGATRLVEAALSPARLVQLGLDAGGALERIEELATDVDPATAGTAAEADRDQLAAWFPRDAVRDELAFLDDPDHDLPPSLPITAQAVARRIHLEVLREEMPGLATAVADDLVAGAARRGPGPAFAAAYDTAVRESQGPVPAARLVGLFRDAGIGAERISDEVGTDLFAATTGRAAAVGTSVADARRAGLGPLRALTRTLRGILLTVYALVYGSVVGSRFGAAAVNLALAAGGALLAMTVLADDPPALVPAAGALLLLGGVGLATLRSRMWTLVAVVGVPAVLLAVVVATAVPSRSLLDNAGPLLVVVAAVAAMMLLGSVGAAPPLTRGPVRGRMAAFGIGLAATAALGVVQAAGPGGIVPFELSFTTGRAFEQVAAWRAAGALDAARDTLRLDYAYLAVYWVPLAVAAVAVGDWLRRRGRVARLARLAEAAAWAPVVAALVDAVENLALLRILDLGGDATSQAAFTAAVPAALPAVAGVAAALKFGLLLAAASYIVAGGLALLRGGSGHGRISGSR